MFDTKGITFQTISPMGENFPTDDHRHQFNTALNKFKSTFLKGKVFRLIQRALKRPQRLYDLNAMNLHLRESFYAGIQVVPICSIIGSEGRTADFDMDFHPLSEAARQRWTNVAIAYLSAQPLEPVQLIQVGDAYFVRDGHHRVSVSRAFGQVAIDAEVITWKASAPFPWQSKTMQKKPVISKATT
jgi:hypothetical protein